MIRMRKDNKGFTLVELMIAVVILAIIVTPFLHSFLTVTKINNKSRRLFRTTTVAENVMEGLSGLKIETIVKQFYDVDLNEHGTVNPFIFSNICTQKGELVEAYGDATNPGHPSVDASGRFEAQGDNVYYLYLDDVQEDNQTYDVRIKLDASVYRSTSANISSSVMYNDQSDKNPEGYAYNEDFLFNVDKMDKTRDYVWVEPEGLKTELVGPVKSALEYHYYANMGKHAGKELQSDEYSSQNYSTLMIITVDNYSGDGTVQVTFHLTARVKCKYCAEAGAIDTTVAARDFNNSYTLTNDSYTRLRNIYLFYYPDYNSKEGDIRDTIHYIDYREEVDGKKPDPINLYIIKQIQPDLTDLVSKEKSYQMDFTYFDTSDDFMNALYDGNLVHDIQGKSMINLRSNLGTVLTSDGEIAPNQIHYSIGLIEYSTHDDVIQNSAKKFFGLDKYSDDPDKQVPRLTGETSNVNDFIYEKTVEVFSGDAYDSGVFDESKKISELSSRQ